MAVLTGINRRVRRFLTGLIIPSYTEFPEEPTEGMIITKNDIMYVCRMWGTNLVWAPIVNVRRSGKFDITTATRYWEIKHNLGEYVMASAYTDTGRVLRVRKITNVIDADPTQYLLRVDVGRSLTGTLTVFATTDNVSDYEMVPIEVSAGVAATEAEIANIKVDREAEEQRLRLLTPGSGQALEYVSTSRELERIETDPAPDPSKYPYLASDIGILGADIKEVAVNVKKIDDQWQQVGARIKQIRREAKDNISKAADRDDVDGIKAAAEIDWSRIYKP